VTRINSGAKGKRGERQAAAAWGAVVGDLTCRRGQQFAGGPESPDVLTAVAAVHLEVKNVERGNPYQWLEQAIRDAGKKVPVVLHHRNRQPWLCIVRLEDLQRLALALQAHAQSGSSLTDAFCRGDSASPGLPEPGSGTLVPCPENPAPE